MIIKKQQVMLALIFCVLIVVGVLCAVYVPALNIMDKGVIVIDAGHGGIDGGVQYGDLTEAVINLDNAKRLQKMLEKRGYSVVLTRGSMNALAKGKKNDMQKRKEIILNSKPDMVISLHVNKYQNASRRGVQVFYDDTKHNKVLGDKFQYLINSKVNKKYVGRDDLTSLGGDYFICKCSPYPTVIVECGFISNAEDRKLLASADYKNYLMQVICDGVESFMLQKVSC